MKFIPVNGYLHVKLVESRNRPPGVTATGILLPTQSQQPNQEVILDVIELAQDCKDFVKGAKQVLAQRRNFGYIKIGDFQFGIVKDEAVLAVCMEDAPAEEKEDGKDHPLYHLLPSSEQ